MKKKLIIAITGASGSIYARQILDYFREHPDQAEIEVLASPTGQAIFSQECGRPLSAYPFKRLDNKDLFSQCASGSQHYHAMIVAPCSMGSLARIAAGTADTLISRTADVFLKERRPLILVPRETPWNLIHIENSRRLVLAGAHLVPASPSFYTHPKTIEELAMTVTSRILDLIGFSHPDAKRWKP